MNEARKRERWDEERIESELRVLVAELGGWPSQSYLLKHGYGGLLSAIQRRGGAEVWAEKLGQVLPRTSGGRLWSDERISETLDTFLAGRSTWPSEREFAAAGLSALYQAIRRHGGQKLWATRYGLTPPRAGRPARAAGC